MKLPPTINAKCGCQLIIYDSHEFLESSCRKDSRYHEIPSSDLIKKDLNKLLKTEGLGFTLFLTRCKAITKKGTEWISIP